MGVPAFFRWLTRKYSSVVIECVEEQPALDKNGKPIPVDASQKNPNGVEFDNFYLDMNGIIHPCTHPENKPAPKNEDEMMTAIFECIDRLFKIVRPRKLIYLAIDGVAPRAKMNQQRSRRFRAAKETKEKSEQISSIRSQLQAKGINLPPVKEKSSTFDSNCITPGTQFMSRLTECLNYFIHDKLNNDPGWKGLKVILSDASVPGEGEHKIMDFIRRQRGTKNYDPNTHHCLCGADADLIMLGLATHEPYFTIIREEFIVNQPHRCEICGQSGHEMRECKGLPSINEDADMILPPSVTRYIFVRLNVLREYLEDDLSMPDLPFEYDFERAIDDWVFMCFFVGNDFLPHLPSLEIREGAIDRLITLYKRAVNNTGGFLTDSGDVNLERVELILKDLGSAEDEIFRKRRRNDILFRSRNKQRQLQERMSKPQFQSMDENEILAQIEKDDPEPDDDVRLWDGGYKDRYYQLKFNLPASDISTRQHIGREYARGLCWVLKYYYQGCASWDWFFPFHYAPFASDIVHLNESLSQFARGSQPFSPLEQLMGVFPAASKSLVPSAWGDLMTNTESNILDFYPIDFMIDLNGKKFAWQGVALLPFVDEARLRKSLIPYYDLLTTEEELRNRRGKDRLYVCRDADCYDFISFLGRNEEGEMFRLKADGIYGTVFMTGDYFQGKDVISPIPGFSVVHDNHVYCVRFEDPKYTINHKFIANRLEGTRDPPRMILSKDRGTTGSRGRGRGRPIVGMVPRMDQATLSESSHRTLRHYVPTDHATPLGNPGSSNTFQHYNRPRGPDLPHVDLTQDEPELHPRGRGRAVMMLLQKCQNSAAQPFGRGRGLLSSSNQSRPTHSDRFSRQRPFGITEDSASSGHYSGGNLPPFSRVPPLKNLRYEQSEARSSSVSGRLPPHRVFNKDEGRYFEVTSGKPTSGGYVRNPKFEHSFGGGNSAMSTSGNRTYRRGYGRGAPVEQSDVSRSDRDREHRSPSHTGFGRGQSNRTDFAVAGGIITKDED